MIEILNQMQIAHECVAKYFGFFNYHENDENPYVTIKNEHFQALDNFWNDVVKNPHVAIKAD